MCYYYFRTIFERNQIFFPTVTKSCIFFAHEKCNRWGWRFLCLILSVACIDFDFFNLSIPYIPYRDGILNAVPTLIISCIQMTLKKNKGGWKNCLIHHMKWEIICLNRTYKLIRIDSFYLCEIGDRQADGSITCW